MTMIPLVVRRMKTHTRAQMDAFAAERIAIDEIALHVAKRQIDAYGTSQFAMNMFIQVRENLTADLERRIAELATEVE